MLLHFPAILAPVQLADMRATLAMAEWNDSRKGGTHGAQARRNRLFADRSLFGMQSGDVVPATPQLTRVHHNLLRHWAAP